MVRLPWFPFGSTFREFSVGQLYVKSPDDRVDFNDIAVPQQRDRPANGGFRPDMADAEPSSGAGKPSIGNPRYLAAPALPGQRRRGREHLPHAGTAARSLIADHDDLTLPVGFPLNSLEGVVFAVKAARRP